MDESIRSKNDLYGPAVEALCKLTFQTPYGVGPPHQCLNKLETHYAAKRILDEIASNPHKYLPDELFGPTLKDTLEVVAKIKDYKKEIEDLKEQLNKQDADYNEAIFQWVAALHEEVTNTAVANEQLAGATARIDTLEHELAHLSEERDAARQQRKRADDWCAEVMKRLCIAGGVDWADLCQDETSVEDMEKALRDNIRLHVDDLYRAELQVAKFKNEYDKQKCLADKMRDELAHLRTFDIEKLHKQCTDSINAHNTLREKLQRVLSRDEAGTLGTLNVE